MISEYTILEVKSRSKIEEVIGGFITLKKHGANMVGCCPFHNEKTPSFTVHIKENFAKCFGCGKSVDSLQFLMDYKQLTYQEAVQHLCNKYKIPFEVSNDNPKVYSRPIWKNNINLSDKIVKWFENERKISQTTLKKAQITEGIEWMPEGKLNGKVIPAGERMTIQFNYFRDGELINTKYRDSVKTFKLHKDAELILYGLESLKDAKECYWVEGEIDRLSLMEAGIQREGVAVVSVPNGASKTTNNLKYIDNCIDQLEHIEWHYLGFDNDPNGRKLREDVAERLGKEKCKYIEWKDKKDGNEVLVNYKIDGVIECCGDKKEFPLEGAFTISSFSDEIDDLYLNGLDMGVGIGIKQFDDQVRFSKGYLTIITGVPSHGKSSMLDQIALLLIKNHDWKFAFYSPENKPTKLHFSKMARLLIGKNWFGANRMSESEKNLAKSYLEGKIWFLKPEKDFTMKSILDSVKMLKKRYGIDAFVIDAYNKLEHKYGKSNETQYISEQLDILGNFCEINNIHCFLVAHPTKMLKDKNKPINYEIPSLYNISGSSAFFSKADVGMCVWRDYTTDVTKVLIQKVRYTHWGKLGYTEWKYDLESGRFNEYRIDPNFTYKEDKSNWLVRTEQAVLDIPEKEETGIITGSHNSDMPF